MRTGHGLSYESHTLGGGGGGGEGSVLSIAYEIFSLNHEIFLQTSLTLYPLCVQLPQYILLGYYTLDGNQRANAIKAEAIAEQISGRHGR